MNVGERTVKRARVVLDKGVPELQAAVEAGNVSVRAAAAVAYKAPEEQREIVSQGPAAIVQAAKAARVSGPKLSVVPPVVDPPKVNGNARIPVPDGMTAEELVRKGMAREASGISPEKAAKEIHIGVEAYRRVRDLITLLNEVELCPHDREIVSGALAAINETKQLAAYEPAAPIVRRVWGSGGVPHTVKAARKRVDHFATVVGIAVQSIANFSLKEFEIPYLSDSERKRWIGEVEHARLDLDAFFKTLRSAA